MANTQHYGKEARLKLLAGVNKLNDAVKTSLGPAGRNTLFRHMGAVISTKDGVTIAREISLADPVEAIGADLVKAAAGQTVDEAGDGTTTATLLTQAIFEAGVKAIDQGAEPVELVRGIEKATTAIVGEYDAVARKFKGGILEKFMVPCSDDLAFETARISANGDEAIARVVADAILKCGVDAAITIGESNSTEHGLETVDGMQLDTGYVHPYFITEPGKARAIYENVTVLLLNRRISTSDEAGSIMERAIKAAVAKGRAPSILVLCDDVDPEPLTLFLKNKVKPQMPIPIVVARTPLWGDQRRDLLEDVAHLIGGRRIESPKGKHMESLTDSDFGIAAKVIVTSTKTTIVAHPMSDQYKESTFNPHLDTIKAIATDQSVRPDLVDTARRRLAALTGGVALIKVGGSSANAVVETKFRVEDALHATRAAVSEGVVPGGGSALLFARELYLGSTPCDPTETAGEGKGMELLASVLSRPISQIVENAGHKPKKIIDEVLQHAHRFSQYRCGFDAKTGQLIDDMVAEGIVDPLRVVRSALNAASSAAGTTLLKTECVLAHDAANTPQQIPGTR